jgi:uncharacterized protein (DUF1786 family)
MENKRKFVASMSDALVLYSRQTVVELAYMERDQMELVMIRYTNGYVKYIDVTGDSCIAIMHDVWRALQ